MKPKIKKLSKEYWPTLGAGAFCAVLGGLWLVYASSSAQIRPVLEQPGAVPFYSVRAANPRPEFGMAVGNTLLSMPEEELNRRLADIKSLGADWIRLDFAWDDIQPASPERFIWAGHDRIARAAAGQGLKIAAILAYTPQWARDPQCQALSPGVLGHKCAPRDDRQFAGFAAAAAARYPTVAAWEIWNEPNSTGFWRQAAGGVIAVDPAAYASLANVTAAAVKQKDPAAKIVSGGLAHIVNPDDPKGMPEAEFLSQALRILDKTNVDALGLHPYTSPASPITPQEWNAYYSLAAGNLGTVLKQAGWSGRELWATEFGASTAGQAQMARVASPDPEVLRGFDHVSEDLQADIMRQAIIGWCRKPHVGPLFIYTDSDQYLQNAPGNEAGFGLRRGDGSPKPSYQAVQESIAAAKQSCAS